MIRLKRVTALGIVNSRKYTNKEGLIISFFPLQM